MSPSRAQGVEKDCSAIVYPVARGGGEGIVYPAPRHGLACGHCLEEAEQRRQQVAEGREQDLQM